MRVTVGETQNRLQILQKIGMVHVRDYLERLRLPKSYVFWDILRGDHSHEKKVSYPLSQIHGDTFFDIGANVGYYSVLLYRNFLRTFAFEPHPENFRNLCQVLAAGGISNVSAFRYAVSSSEGEAFLFVGKTAGEHALKEAFRNERTSDDKEEGFTFGRGIMVQTITLDKFLSRFERVDLIKVDVEGSEWRVLEGAQKSMPIIRRWEIESHDPERREEMERLLQSYGYKTRWLDTDHIFGTRNGEYQTGQ
jgi:FkbM family methyltransferase